MKILAIMGSPRMGGNTDVLIDEALRRAAEEGASVDKLAVAELDISPCLEKHYDEAFPDGLPAEGDDMRLVVEKIKTSDAVLTGSPVFFGSVTGQLKVLIDRFQFAWLSRDILKKDVFGKKRAGGFICVGAQDKEDFYFNSRQIVRHFYSTLNIDPAEEAFFPGLEAKAAALDNEAYMAKAGQIGRDLARMIKTGKG
ncbi:MAG: hypothetical protein GF408_03295 [Candidatus Omnitrophica bacterium]|nr:hypothetical protein [Candidatus Omnitrophota bacterium]